MPSAGAVRAGAAYVEMFLDQSAIVRGLASVQSKLRGWSASLGNLGSAAFGGGLPGPLGAIAQFASSPAGVLSGLLLASKQFASFGDNLDKMSSRVGASVEFLSALSHAAKIGGTDISAMEVGIRRLQRTTYDASRGLSTAKDAFSDLGINIYDSNGQLKLTEQLFMESAAALSRMENNTKKAALATVVFGRAGTTLLPMLREGPEGLMAVMEEARRLGLVMSTEDATAAAQFSDAMTRLMSVLRMAAVRIGGELAPALTALSEKLAVSGKRAVDWIKSHGEVFQTAMKVAGAITAGGIAVKLLGKAIGAVATAIGAVRIAITALAATPLGAAMIAAMTVAITAQALAWRQAANEIERYNRVQSAGEMVGAPVKTFEKGIRERNLGVTQQAVDQMLANRDRLAAEVKKLEEGLQTNRTVAEWAMGWDNAEVAKDLEQKKLDLKQAEVLLERYKTMQAEMASAGKLRTSGQVWFDSAIAAAKNAGIEVGRRFYAGLEAYTKANQAAMDELTRLKAEATPDAQQREIALVNVEYDRKVREAKERGANPALVEEARQQAIANTRDRYAREAADKDGREAQQAADERLRAEEQIQEEIARLQIEATKKGIEKERALLELKHREELKQARELGADLDLLRRKQELEHKILGVQGQLDTVRADVVGTFSGHALPGLGAGDDTLKSIENQMFAFVGLQTTIVGQNETLIANTAEGGMQAG